MQPADLVGKLLSASPHDDGQPPRLSPQTAVHVARLIGWPGYEGTS